MAVPRDEPYVWVTWISRVMAGEAHCQWAAWFRAHHTYDKRPSDFDVAAWTAQHAVMVRQRVDRLRADGFTVTIENQNAFKMRGSRGTVLAGKPDLVAVRGDQVVVIDCKTGSPQMSDQLQVLVYMLILPLTHAACRGRSIDGELQYRRDTVPIPAAKITPELRELFRDTMHRVGGDAAPGRVPSHGECRFCDIRAEDCSDRIDTAPDSVATGHDLF